MTSGAAGVGEPDAAGPGAEGVAGATEAGAGGEEAGGAAGDGEASSARASPAHPQMATRAAIARRLSFFGILAHPLPKRALESQAAH